MKRLKKIEVLDIVVWLIAIVMLAIVFIPFLYVLAMSLSGSAAILQGKVSIFPVDFTLASYVEMLKTPKILNAYKNSFIYVGLETVIAICLLLLTAYPLSRRVLPGRGKLIGLILFTMFFSGGLVPFYLLIQSLGFMDTIWAIVIPWAIPQFQLLLLKGYFENVPEEIYEAAVVDGASEYRIFGQIFVPLAVPIIATVIIMVATTSWNSYMIPLMYINDPAKYPLQLVLREMLVEENLQDSMYTQAATLTPTGLKNATVVISILPLLILYPFLQKYFIGSIYAGAVKG